MEKMNKSAMIHITKLHKFLKSSLVDISDSDFMEALENLHRCITKFIFHQKYQQDLRARREPRTLSSGLAPRHLSKAAKDRLRTLVRAARTIMKNHPLVKTSEMKRLECLLERIPLGTDHGLDEYVKSVSDKPWNVEYAVSQLLYLVENKDILTESVAVSTMLINLRRRLRTDEEIGDLTEI